MSSGLTQTRQDPVASCSSVFFPNLRSDLCLSEAKFTCERSVAGEAPLWRQHGQGDDQFQWDWHWPTTAVVATFVRRGESEVESRAFGQWSSFRRWGVDHRWWSCQISGDGSWRMMKEKERERVPPAVPDWQLCFDMGAGNGLDDDWASRWWRPRAGWAWIWWRGSRELGVERMEWKLGFLSLWHCLAVDGWLAGGRCRHSTSVVEMGWARWPGWLGCVCCKWWGREKGDSEICFFFL